MLGVVGKHPQMFRRPSWMPGNVRESFPDFWEWSGGPPRFLGMVGRPCRMSGSDGKPSRMSRRLR